MPAPPASAAAARSPSPTAAPPLRFGAGAGAPRFELQPAERRLLVDGKPASLGARALDLLIVLAERPDHLLGKGELLDRVWPGLVVEEANLHVQISHLRKLLGGEVIGTVPGRGYRFTGTLALSAPDAAAPAASPPQPAPPRPRLFGRDADLQRLEQQLQPGCCVSLVGTSGVGKTSLARSAAARWRGRHAWVDLAALVDGAQVVHAAARALGVPLDGAAGDIDGVARLVSAMQGGPHRQGQSEPLLLVLDNAEHLVQACAGLAARLQAVPALSLLVTSQLPLAIGGERVQRLEPLSLPPPGPAEIGDGAMALLVERITAADHRFTVSWQSLPLLAAICAQLDGLPLALEMAAARVPSLGLQAVHDALAQRFSLLTRGHRDAAARHRSLHNALDWSYRLLTPGEQRLFRALGVFVGGFSLELAVALASGEGTPDGPARWDVIDGIGSLVDRSLVVASADDPPRYRLLETMNAFALEQLAQAGEEATLRRNHAAALLALFLRHTPGDRAAAALCLAEMENAGAALAWARQHRSELALAAQLSAAIMPVTTFTAWRQESANWLLALEPAMEAAAAAGTPPLPVAVQAGWWAAAARCLSIRRDPRAAAGARRALSLWQSLGETRHAAMAAMVLVRSVRQPGPELDESCAQLTRMAEAADAELSPRDRLLVHAALVAADTTRNDLPAILTGRLKEMELAAAVGAQEMVDAAETNVLNVLVELGRYEETIERGHRLLARIDAAGEGASSANLPWLLWPLMVSLIRTRRLDQAQALAPRSAAAGQRFGFPVVWGPLAALAAAQGRHAAAAQLVGHARESFGRAGLVVTPETEEELKATWELAAEVLGAREADDLVRQGRALDARDAAQLTAPRPA